MGKQRNCRDHFRFYTLLICYANDAQHCQSQVEAALRTTVLYILNKRLLLKGDVWWKNILKWPIILSFACIVFYDIDTHSSTFRHCQVIIIHPF